MTEIISQEEKWPLSNFFEKNGGFQGVNPDGRDFAGAEALVGA